MINTRRRKKRSKKNTTRYVHYTEGMSEYTMLDDLLRIIYNIIAALLMPIGEDIGNIISYPDIFDNYNNSPKSLSQKRSFPVTTEKFLYTFKPPQ